MYKNDISACIVLYNANYDEVKVCVDSFLENSKDHIILVDNNSQNATFENLKKIYMGNLKVMFEKLDTNLGFGHGHNHGFKILQQRNMLGKYHIILNPDVIILQKTLLTLKNFMDTDESICISVPKISNPDGSLQPLNKNHPTIFDMFIRRFLPKWILKRPFFQRKYNEYIRMNIGYDAICEVPFASGCFMFFRSSVFESLGGFDENFFLYMEDADISRRAWKLGRVIYNPNANIVHIWKRESSKSLKMTMVMLRSMQYYFKKHGCKIV